MVTHFYPVFRKDFLSRKLFSYIRRIMIMTTKLCSSDKVERALADAKITEDAKKKYTVDRDIESCYRGAGTMVFAIENDMRRGPQVKRQMWNIRDADQNDLNDFKASLGEHQVRLDNLSIANAIILGVRGAVLDFKTLSQSWDSKDLKRLQWLEGATDATDAVININGNHRATLMEEICGGLVKALNEAKSELGKFNPEEMEYAKHLREIGKLEGEIERTGLWAVKVYDLGMFHSLE